MLSLWIGLGHKQMVVVWLFKNTYHFMRTDTCQLKIPSHYSSRLNRGVHRFPRPGIGQLAAHPDRTRRPQNEASSAATRLASNNLTPEAHNQFPRTSAPPSGPKGLPYINLPHPHGRSQGTLSQ